MNAFFQELTNSLRNNKLRTFLTGFSIAWGIIILVVMLGAGRGVENGIRSMITAAGANRVEISMKLEKTSIAYGGYKEWRQLELTPNQLEYIRQIFANRVDAIEPKYQFFNDITSDFGSNNVQRQTLTEREQSFNKLEVTRGRLFNPLEHEEGARVILLSDNTLSKLFAEGNDPIGQVVTMFGISFEVIGVVKAPMPFYGVCIIPYSTYAGLYPNEVLKYRALSVYPLSGDAAGAEQLTNDIKGVLERLLRVDPKDTFAISVQSSTDRAKTMDKIFLSLQVLLWVMGVGSLSIGTIGVSNIMHVTIQERMREIGIRKAIGAKPKDIMRLVLGESLILSVVAGTVGLVLGIGIIKLIDYLAEANKWGQQTVPAMGDNGEPMVMTLFENPTVNMDVAVGALIVLVIAGLLAGYGPAKKAIRIPAVEAMRDTK